jgi:hypothetical protein
MVPVLVWGKNMKRWKSKSENVEEKGIKREDNWKMDKKNTIPYGFRTDIVTYIDPAWKYVSS